MAQQHNRGSNAPGFVPRGNSRRQQEALRSMKDQKGKGNKSGGSGKKK